VDYQLYRMLDDALIGVVWMRLARCGGGAAGRKVSPFQLSFNGRLKVNFQGGRASLSDGGLPLVRELPECTGSGALAHRAALGQRASYG
jgi:hypothetical protein